MKKYSRLFFLLICGAVLSTASFAFAADLKNPLGDVTFLDVLKKVAEYIATLIAGLVTIMIIWAGILFVTSAGNPGKIETAKKIVIYAIVGAAIALVATGIIDLIKKIIGVD